ncbi:transketolase-like TK C-terminal-containing protein [Virgibacillus siamensis]|uniref:transketolase-like TK C-terminal-containing protein n=1 Tax=Virgibacillus siamensis TaxID=480071 RepID=UPI00098483CC|nr:hypothetical protein [Virgibacillus siamensis]
MSGIAFNGVFVLIASIYYNVVSMPSWELIEKQGRNINSVLPPGLKKRLVNELRSKVGWKEYAGASGSVMSVNEFGASGPSEEVVDEYNKL